MKSIWKRIAILCMLPAFVSLGQQSTSSFDPSFEVAFIKPSDPMERRGMMHFDPGKMGAKNWPLIGMISFAYDIKSDGLISNVPDWAKLQRYDIEAKSEEEVVKAIQKLPQEERGRVTRRMVQKLLEERLHLKLIKESKEQTVYNLVVAKSGSKLKASSAPPPPPPSEEPGNGPRAPRGMMRNGRGELAATDSTTGMLTDVLSHMPETEGRVVNDKTGLKGPYVFTLKWAPEAPAPAFRGADSGAPPPTATDTSGPSLVTALEEQLGLRLESGKDRVDSYRIETIEKPTEN